MPFCRFASALIKLASTAKASPPTSPSRMQRRRTVSNTRRSRSLSRNRPCRSSRRSNDRGYARRAQAYKTIDRLVIWNRSSPHYRSARSFERRALMANAGRRGRPIGPVVLSAQERAYLERQVRRHRVARSLSERCRVILRCADGLASKDVAAELGHHEHTVGKWRRRFLKDRCDGLLDEVRPGRPRTIDDDQVAAVIERTLRTTPANATHWSIRSMAAETGFSHTTIRRMWAAFGLQPHRSQTFKLSTGSRTSTAATATSMRAGTFGASLSSISLATAARPAASGAFLLTFSPVR